MSRLQATLLRSGVQIDSSYWLHLLAHFHQLCASMLLLSCEDCLAFFNHGFSFSNLYLSLLNLFNPLSYPGAHPVYPPLDFGFLSHFHLIDIRNQLFFSHQSPWNTQWRWLAIH
jgi:hypothetical protein